MNLSGAAAGALIASLLFLTGCSVLETQTATAPEARAQKVVVLVSDRIAAYQDVADALRARLPHATVYRLDGDDRKARALVESLRPADASVVAIGPTATRAAARLQNRNVIFCQYFRPELTGDPTEGLRGVRAVPPAAKQLQAWKALYPGLERVALFAGPGIGDFFAEARQAAADLAIGLDVVLVRSDREFLYAVKRVDALVQGIWLFPDHRVMSADSLREALAHALREGRQTLVFSQQLLEYGGLLAVEGDPQDIAERVLEQLRAAEDEAPRVARLRRVRTRVNLEIARQLGLDVPAPLDGGSRVF